MWYTRSSSRSRTINRYFEVHTLLFYHTLKTCRHLQVGRSLWLTKSRSGSIWIGRLWACKRTRFLTSVFPQPSSIPMKSNITRSLCDSKPSAWCTFVTSLSRCSCIAIVTWTSQSPPNPSPALVFVRMVFQHGWKNVPQGDNLESPKENNSSGVMMDIFIQHTLFIFDTQMFRRNFMQNLWARSVGDFCFMYKYC